MRVAFSYGFAGLIILIGAAWLATGTLVIGGDGRFYNDVAIQKAIRIAAAPATVNNRS